MTHHLPLALSFLLAGALLASPGIPQGMNRFAAAAYRQMAGGQDNLILSPFSIATALSMLLEGARGQTAAGIAAALNQVNPGSGYHAAIASLATELTKQANVSSNRLAVANGLWVQKGFPLQPDFEQTLRTIYHAPLTPVDFHMPEQARQEINAWTAHETNDKIQELFPRGSIEATLRLVLTSAIYFYGKWLVPFDRQNTRPEPFQVDGGRTVEAKFMHRDANFLYGETPDAQILEMKYAGTQLAFDILLPKATGRLPALEQSLKAEILDAWFGTLRIRKVETAIPKFRATSAFSLRDMLSHMGMADAFLKTADFSGIDGRRDLCVGDVFHQAFVEVSEEGTEAAAATGITVRPMLARRPEEPVVFRADHPFTFFIRDTASGVILFEGRLIEPK